MPAKYSPRFTVTIREAHPLMMRVGWVSAWQWFGKGRTIDRALRLARKARRFTWRRLRKVGKHISQRGTE